MEISGIRMLVGLLAGVTLLIILVLKTKIQSFLALIICTIAVGVIGGMPLTATDMCFQFPDNQAFEKFLCRLSSVSKAPLQRREHRFREP